ncbi:DUF6603 domain-containing protein [Leptothoe spongobia]|uniref:DUF6603 domain-containing protein n=1 Tax=Leptothoe spongobia TAU-MAC 1115 TaxID=1967444 RepID=A0A947GG96_9CYAN|nr:DUF6603 domain-containing protein [Leptothoe spongobia]MBT9314053.1 hypothetical protein [Leptothoe spongobia TAU-MAC 1115]
MANLNTLASNLKAQAATNSTIALDSTVFSTDVLANIRAAFGLEADVNLTLTGVNATDISAPSNGILTISAGTASVLNQDNVDIGLAFTESAGSLQALIIVTMSDAWKFSDSFNGLDIFPFSNLNLSAAQFVFITTEQTAYPWPGDPSQTIPLEPGLNFLADITLDNFSIVSDLLGTLIGPNSFKFYGPFTPTDGQYLPVGTIKAPLGTGTFSIGVAPNALTLANPAVAVRIDTANINNPLQNIDLLVEAEYNNTLTCAIGIPMSGRTLGISTKPLPNQSSINSLIESLPGGSGFTSFIPSELSSIFANVGLDNFAMVVQPDPRVSYLSLSISTLQPWSVISDVLVLEGLTLRIETIDPTGSNWTRVYIDAQAEFLPNIFDGEFDFVVRLERQTSWQVSTVSGSYYGAVSLGKIVGELLGNQESVPASLRAIAFSDFGVSATRSAIGSPFSYSFYGSVETAFPILDTALVAQLYLSVTKTPTSHEIFLSGALAIGDQAFSLTLDLGTVGAQLRATWQTQGDYLELEDIASAFDLEVPETPDEISLALEAASFTYDFASKTLVIEAVSANFGHAVFVTFKNTTTAKWQFYFGLAASRPLAPSAINLSNLPLVGSKFPPEQTVSINGLKFLILSQALTVEQVDTLNPLIPDGSAKLPSHSSEAQVSNASAIRKGLSISANLQLGSTTEALALPISSDDQSTIEPAPAASTTPVPVADNTKWFPIKKAFGPLYFGRVGIQYKDTVLWFLLDASLSAAGLTLALDGLSIGSSLKEFKPQFNLQGIGISYESKGAVSIGGAFLRSTINGRDDYSGIVIIKTEAFTLSALGSYTTTAEGHPSLFIYGVLDKPLGGPAFFFVTGLALGFAYNRRLIMPTLDEVGEFPLVRAVLSGGNANVGELMQIQQDLQPYIPPKVGQLVLAVGIKFTSFKLIESFVLLVVTIGDQFALDLLGISTLISPPVPPGIDPNALPPPLAKVRIGILARFVPDEGTLTVAGKILPGSYLFEQACRLSGGFAFYCWFKGEHAGDFVLTVGGYHPRFQVPAHYPKVDPLALNWRISNELTVKGSIYFALTASAIMAGGSLEAVYKSGNLKAWFIAKAHFIVSWQPYFYDARMSLNVGGSYTFKVFGASETITVDVGADLHIWGPEFSGIAEIDLDIVSFTVRFGNYSQKKPAPIGWTKFKDSFLPTDQDVCTIAVESGLLRKLGERDSEIWIVNPKEFVLNTSSVIPIKTGDVGEILAESDESPPTKAFGIAPMEVKRDGFNQSSYHISIKKNNQEVGEHFKCKSIVKNVPTALWGESNSNDTNRERFINNVLSGYTIRPANPPKPGKTQAIERKNLAYDVEKIDNAYQWGSFLISKESKETDEDTRQETIGHSIISEAVENTRNRLLQSLGLSDIDINLEDFKTEKGREQAFVIAPQLEVTMT